MTFHIPKLGGTYVIVVNKLTGAQTLYWNPNIAGRLQNYLRHVIPPREIPLREPAVQIFDMPRATSFGFCPQCGAFIHGGVQRCPTCGRAIENHDGKNL
jgi:hypothetical protein